MKMLRCCNWVVLFKICVVFALCFISCSSEVLVSCLILIGWEGPEVKQDWVKQCRRSHSEIRQQKDRSLWTLRLPLSSRPEQPHRTINRKSSVRTGNAMSARSCGGLRDTAWRAGALFMDRWILSCVHAVRGEKSSAQSSALGSYRASLQRSGESVTFTHTSLHITVRRV